MPRVLATLLTVVATMALAAGTAMAQYPPPTEGGTTVSDATVEPGEAITVSGSGWLPGSTVTLTLFSDPIDLGSAAVGADGTFSTQVVIPSSVSPGTHELRVSGTGADGQPRTTSTRLVVLGAQGGGGGSASGSGVSRSGVSGSGESGSSGLAVTGSAAGMTAALALVLLALGLGVLLIARRRSGTEKNEPEHV